MLSLRIALRYLFSKKSHNAINILSLVSVVGVAVATTAMVIVLSVFNGFSDLAASKLSLLDPDLAVKDAKGKIFSNADSIAEEIERIEGVEAASPILREQALAVASSSQMPVTIQGMTGKGTDYSGMSHIMIDGMADVGYIDNPESPLDRRPTAVLSVGVAVSTGLRSGDGESIRIYVPRRLGRVNPSNPMNAFLGDTLLVAGVYRVEQAEYDTDMVMVPLNLARRLLQYNEREASAIQVVLAPDADTRKIKQQIGTLLGDRFEVLDRHQQQQQAFRMIAVEKWITFLMLAFILIITSFNIISSIYILKIEKNGNIGILLAMGYTPAAIRSIFAWQGRMITLAGGAIGLLLGTLLTLLQQHLGFIRLQASDSSLLAVEAYPVRLAPGDLLSIAVIVTAVAFLCAWIATIRKS